MWLSGNVEDYTFEHSLPGTFIPGGDHAAPVDGSKILNLPLNASVVFVTRRSNP